MDNWKILITFTYPHEAHMAKGFLESEGIDTEIRDEYTAQVNNFYSNAIGGVKILIEESNYENGLKILQKGGFVNPDNAENEIKIDNVRLDRTADKSLCPFCHSKNIGKNKEANILTIVVFFILGAFFPIFKSSYTCFDCEKKWKFDKKQ